MLSTAEGRWDCPACELTEPAASWVVDGASIHTPHGDEVTPQLRVPGTFNVSNAACALAAGGTILKQAQEVFWGGYSGYFADPDGFSECILFGNYLYCGKGHPLFEVPDSEISTADLVRSQYVKKGYAVNSNLQQVNSAVSDMDRMTQQNAAMVEQSSAAARSLASEAATLSGLVERFRTGSGSDRGSYSMAA